MSDSLYMMACWIAARSLEQWSYLASIVGALVAIIGFPLLGWQLIIAHRQRQDAIRLSTSQVLLAVDAVLATHSDVARKLREGWVENDGTEHPTPEELPIVEPYLGVFERVFIAHRLGQVDIETIDQLYGYRLARIWANQPIVRMKLQSAKLKHSWKRIIGLTYVLEAHRGRRFAGHTDAYFPEDLFDRRSAREIRRKIMR